MKGKGLSHRVPLIVVLALFILAGTVCAYFNPLNSAKNSKVLFKRDVILAEEVVYYSDKIPDCDLYPEPVRLPAGTRGTIETYITKETASESERGLYLCTLYFPLENGKYRSFDFSTDSASCKERTSDRFDTPYVDEIHISKLSTYKALISDYNQAVDKALGEIAKERNSARIKGAVTVMVRNIIISAGIFVVHWLIVRKGRSAAFLFWIFAGIDTCLIILAVFNYLIWSSIG